MNCNDNVCHVDGFTIEEENFMQKAIELLRQGVDFDYISKNYNYDFNTSLAKEEVKARFDDFMTEMFGVRKHKTEVEKFLETVDREFIETHSIVEILTKFYTFVENKQICKDSIRDIADMELQKAKFYTTEFSKMIDNFIK